MSQHGCPERLSNRSKGFQEDGPSQPTMEVLVETLTGTAFEMTVSPSDTIFAIKSKIFRVEGIPVSQQHLLYNLKELEDASSLREHAIADGARLRLVLGMRGGPISTRRLPPPAPASAEPWPDIERLLDSNRYPCSRDDVEWGGGGGGCKVTVLVFRDGERVNMLRVRENRDGTYSPLDSSKYSGRLSQLAERGTEGAGALRENAVTMGKMLTLRRRMEALSLQRAEPRQGEKVEIQKTRSEETLSAPHLLDEAVAEPYARDYASYGDAEDSFSPVYDRNYTRYSFECGARDAEPAPPAPRRASRREGDDGAILEECVGDDCVRPEPPRLQPRDYGPLGGGCAWRGARGGHSASALQLRAGAPLEGALFSSSTSDLENLKRNSRILPALSRARPREHLHLSDEGLHLPRRERRDGGPAAERREGGLGTERREGGLGTEHREGALGAERREPGLERPERREVGSERRQHRIEKITSLDTRVLRFPDDPPRDEPQEHDPAVEVKEKKIRVRCALCHKRLSIATVHRCRCGAPFCAPHRYAEVHGCAYDYKAEAGRLLARANPLVSAPKLPKI